MPRVTYPKEKKKGTPSRYRRKLHIDGEVWTWQVGRDTIVASSPDGVRRFKWAIVDFFGVTPDKIERAHRKRTGLYNVTPNLVKQEIEIKLAIEKSTRESNKRFNSKAYHRRLRIGRGLNLPLLTDYERDT